VPSAKAAITAAAPRVYATDVAVIEDDEDDDGDKVGLTCHNVLGLIGSDATSSEEERRKDRDDEEEVRPVKKDTRKRIVLIALSVELRASREEEDEDQYAERQED